MKFKYLNVGIIIAVVQVLHIFVKKLQTMLYNGDSADKRKKGCIEIYEAYKNSGLSNRYIWKHYVYPVWGISERTFYYYLKQAV